MVTTEWTAVLDHMLAAERVIADARALTSAPRNEKNLHRNGHPLDTPLRNVRANISKVAALVTGDPYRRES